MLCVIGDGLLVGWLEDEPMVEGYDYMPDKEKALANIGCRRDTTLLDS